MAYMIPPQKRRKLVRKYRLLKYSPHFDAYMITGFECVMPLSKIRIFDENELEMLLGGLAEINVEDWRTNTRLDGFGASPFLEAYLACLCVGTHGSVWYQTMMHRETPIDSLRLVQLGIFFGLR